jgi:hypothetical protein
MKMIQVINGEVKQYSLPKVGILSTGESVSGYHLLDEEILSNEGWLPLEDVEPEYDEETQYLVQDGYEILEDKVIKKYRIEEIPEREEPRDLEVEIEEDAGMLALMVSMLMSEVDMLKSEIENLKEGK